jgi:hypothetical protein
VNARTIINLYLDIDGVLLGKNGNGEIALIPNIEEFLEYTRNNFQCNWLTTHCRDGKLDGIHKHLRPFFRDHDISVLDHMKPLKWNTLKTEAIDFDTPFIWIDDAPLEYEIEILKKMGCLQNWLQVDTHKNYYDLTIDRLEKKQKEIMDR